MSGRVTYYGGIVKDGLVLDSLTKGQGLISGQGV